MLMNHKNFPFTPIPDKTNDMIFLKSPKPCFWAIFNHFWLFCPMGLFFKILALSHTIINELQAPCKNSGKFNEPIPKKLTDRRRDKRQDRQTARQTLISQEPSTDGQESKETIHNSSKTISSRSLNNKYFENIHLNLLNCTFKISKIYLKQKVFSYEFTETKKR